MVDGRSVEPDRVQAASLTVACLNALFQSTTLKRGHWEWEGRGVDKNRVGGKEGRRIVQLNACFGDVLACLLIW